MLWFRFVLVIVSSSNNASPSRDSQLSVSSVWSFFSLSDRHYALLLQSFISDASYGPSQEVFCWGYEIDELTSGHQFLQWKSADKVFFLWSLCSFVCVGQCFFLTKSRKQRELHLNSLFCMFYNVDSCRCFQFVAFPFLHQIYTQVEENTTGNHTQDKKSFFPLFPFHQIQCMHLQITCWCGNCSRKLFFGNLNNNRNQVKLIT